METLIDRIDLESEMDPNKPGTPATGERRRSPRGRITAPALVRVKDLVIEGTVENLSYAGVKILSHGDLPEVGAACEVVLKLPAGTVGARGKVARVEIRNNCFAVDLAHVDTGGELLLATILMSGG